MMQQRKFNFTIFRCQQVSNHPFIAIHEYDDNLDIASSAAASILGEVKLTIISVYVKVNTVPLNNVTNAARM